MRSSFGSSTGTGWRRELTTNSAPATAAPTSEPSTFQLVQPQLWPWTIASVSSAIATARSSAPRRSGSVRRPGARLSTRYLPARTTASTPSGMLIRKTRRQLYSSTSAPPSGGPSPAASAAAAPHRPTACERRSAGNACTTSASEAGTSSAAPAACSTRAAVSIETEDATPQKSEATVKTTIPVVNIRRLPKRSASRPDTTRNAANTMLYAFSTHDSDSIELPWNDDWMLGNATLTIVASRNASSAPNDATSSAPVLSIRLSAGAAAAETLTPPDPSASTLGNRGAANKTAR